MPRSGAVILLLLPECARSISFAASETARYIVVTKNPSDLYVFKVASLRNVEKTGPSFHDGSVASLDSAILLMGRHQLGRELTPAQIAALRTWLATLTGELPAAHIGEPPKPQAVGR